MVANIFDQNLNNPQNPTLPKVPQIPKEQKEINEINETEFLDKTKKRNRKKLIKLNFLEKERIAQNIFDKYTDVRDDQKKLEDDIDKWDEVYRMLKALHKLYYTDSVYPSLIIWHKSI